ncbi:hypothetical protein [Georgfuchsia toluolica]|uniref:hypothetical protein n=1 Tax=Georgfuchsia toluolica TaxID=424218 RepID=UPI001C72A6C7|nr:hypothetical protein [Georgfuchsia toluolica]
MDIINARILLMTETVKPLQNWNVAEYCSNRNILLPLSGCFLSNGDIDQQAIIQCFSNTDKKKTDYLAIAKRSMAL